MEGGFLASSVVCLTFILFPTQCFHFRLFRFCVPQWVHRVCELTPDQRTPKEVNNLCTVMKPLKGFRKFSRKDQELIARTASFECFGKRRVIVKKGHIGTCFYIIYSGSVAVLLKGHEDQLLVSGTKLITMR